MVAVVVEMRLDACLDAVTCARVQQPIVAGFVGGDDRDEVDFEPRSLEYDAEGSLAFLEVVRRLLRVGLLEWPLDESLQFGGVEVVRVSIEVDADIGVDGQASAGAVARPLLQRPSSSELPDLVGPVVG